MLVLTFHWSGYVAFIRFVKFVLERIQQSFVYDETQNKLFDWDEVEETDAGRIHQYPAFKVKYP